jgi:hypothetical protein
LKFHFARQNGLAKQKQTIYEDWKKEIMLRGSIPRRAKNYHIAACKDKDRRY